MKTKKTLIIEHNQFLASDEDPYVCKLDGCRVLGIGASPDDAVEDFIQRVNNLVKFNEEVVVLTR